MTAEPREVDAVKKLRLCEGLCVLDVTLEHFISILNEAIVDNEFVEPSSSNNIKILEHSLVPPVTLSSLLPVAQQVPSSMSSSNFLFLLEEEAAVMPAPLRV